MRGKREGEVREGRGGGEGEEVKGGEKRVKEAKEWGGKEMGEGLRGREGR